MAYKLNDFEVLELIGSGSFGSCYKVRCKHTHELLVWKVIDYGCMPEEKKQLLVTEVTLLRDLRHPHIVRYFDRIVCKETKQLYILIEYCPGGDLATVIKSCIKSNTYVEERFVWRVFHQLISALQTCHSWISSTIILHRDIKPANVFLDDGGNVKLGDFGLACRLDADQPGCIETMVGTPFYMSPEVMKGEMYNSKSDVWSLGCLIYELCSLKPPFHAQNIKELASKVTKGRFERIPVHYSDSLQRVLNHLLLVNQEQRPSVFDFICDSVILSHLPSESQKFTRRPVPTNISSIKAPPPSPADREPEKVSKDTFQSEWLTRLQNLRDKEAALRNRELLLDEKEHTLSRREHRVALMERAVRDKMILAEVYLKRCRENRSGPPCPPRKSQPKEWKNIDESFSADPGDTSVMPTSALMDPAQVPKPLNFFPSHENHTVPQDRRVHFDDRVEMTHTPMVSSKPSFAKIAEAIRSNKVDIDCQTKPRTHQKVLNLPGYTGPAITVDVPYLESDFPLNVASSLESENQQTSSPSVKLTVLFDDRKELQQATSRIDALNLEPNPHLFDAAHEKSVFNIAALPKTSEEPRSTAPVNNIRGKRNIGASVDSLLDTKYPSTNNGTSTYASEIVFPNDVVLRKNAFGGSARRRRKSSCRSSTPVFSESKVSVPNSRENIENAKNNALLYYQKENNMKMVSGSSQRRSIPLERGKENLPSKDAPPPVPKRTVATSLLALPSAAAAAASAVVSKSKKSYISSFR
ncbi:Serine/threonine-protein kinase Nek2 [Frankliniella fusca]|uniref:non-specific serine/threonine protein kinase n=1 Tax=Frankliniella fusca TaxID=407009 RepID=A0AAE1LJZ4_9NEOP|nr:Serine/threonine-protein kinase Nek2 [Frankliniella fusca]